MERPPVLDRISWQKASYKDGWIYDCFGGRVPAYVHGSDRAPESIAEHFYPALNNEIFQFESLFQAVLNARDHFTMLELGCGYARWLLLAAGARRSAHPGMQSTLIGVEADTTHFAWANEVVQANGLAAKLVNAAISHEDGEAEFLVLEDAAHQYGQSFIYPWTQSIVEDLGMKFAATKVPTVTLETLLADIDFVDYIDADIQGAEADVFEAAASVLDRKVARVFNETHGFPLEERLLSLFDGLGWQKVYNFPPYGPSETPYGRFDFEGGVQVFLNPRFLTR